MAKKHKLQNILAPLLYLLAYLYQFIIYLRKKLYDYKIFYSYKPKLLTICVGNISWGGTGKSPIVSYLVNFLEKRNFVPLILTRGYGKKFDNYPILLNHRTINNLTVEEKSKTYPDEALMLLDQNPDLDIIIDPKRARSAKAYDEGRLGLKEKSCLILDDGFSHFGLARDLDLVLLDKDDLLPEDFQNKDFINWNKTIPFGTWRENHTALFRAEAFLLKCPKEEWELVEGQAQKKLKIYKKPLFVFEMSNFSIYNIFTKKKWVYQSNQPYAVVCALGNPEQFKKSLENFLECQAKIDYFMPDHHNFDADFKLFEEILRKMPIVCTEKDAVKLMHFEKFKNTEHSIYVLKSSATFHNSLFYQNDEKSDESLNFENWLTTKLK